MSKDAPWKMRFDRRDLFTLKHVVLLAHSCGACPLSLPCWSGYGFLNINEVCWLFDCARCHCVGWVLATRTDTLYVCARMRNLRESSQIAHSKKDLKEQSRHVETVLMGNHAFMPDGYGDIPHGCITRCRSNIATKADGITLSYVWDGTRLPATIDCRSTVAEKLHVVRR